MLRSRKRTRGFSGGGSAPLRIISTGGQTLGQSTTGLSTVGSSRDDGRHIMKVPVTATNVRLVYGNFYFNPAASLVEIQGTNQITVDGAIEYSSNFYPQLFSGDSTKAILPSDSPVAGDSISGLTITGGSNIYMRHSTTYSTSEQVPIGRIRQTGLLESNIFSTNPSSQTNGTGAMTGTTAPFGYAPIMLIGVPSTPVASIALIGDSIADATSYDVSTGDGNANIGYFARGFYAANIPFVKITRGSMRTYGFIPANAPKSWELVQYCTHVVIQTGTNDLAQPASGDYTLAAIQANFQAMWAQARSMGKKAIQVKILPRTTSASGNWTSAIDQTAVSRFGIGQDRDLLNTWFDAQKIAGNLDDVWDFNTVFEDPIALSKWKTDGTNKFSTQDGTHPSQNAGGFAAGVPVAQVYAAALTV